MGYNLGKMVLHIGSAEGGKDKAIDRFITNFRAYPKDITEKLILENDDKTFTAKDVLHICKTVSAPMVLDIHHHLCNNDEDSLEDIIEEIFNTWNEEKLPPKIHVSSPKSGEKDRRHADYIEVEDFIRFIEMCKPLKRDIDVMIEAKQKDLALYKLVQDIKRIKSEWKFIDNTTFEV